ncbi:tRNA (5-methylaminomethyl-2-thiouridine)(34)-methyltransferase MnmD [Halobacteriovorax marinus]|uniref:tRNA (5-methylaminomethyl-2-thiouridine)(34)-methyltransferase MnmD n=1 Tax=Halobacteriovorax marinus TaxID=97084 RepID=UPI003A93D6A7
MYFIQGIHLRTYRIFIVRVYKNWEILIFKEVNTISSGNNVIFTGQLGSYSSVTTADQSVTLYSEYFDEKCHSSAGAISETDYNYIQGCEVLERLKTDSPFTIFEVGYGVGLGAIRTFELSRHKQPAQISFISCELDEELVKWTIQNQKHPLIQTLEKVLIDGEIYYQSKLDHFTLTIIIGDIREKFSKAMHDLATAPLMAIYQDAFSPKKNPSLWTKEWFTELKEHSDERCILSTYSAAMGVRKALMEANWNVFRREGYGEKRSTTIARSDLPMKEQFRDNILRSPDLCLEDKLIFSYR